MKYSTYSTIASIACATVVVQGQATSSKICTKIVEFNACTMKATTNQANCNSKVVSTPTFEYWDCVCNAQNESLLCYSLCPDDVNMQLQYQANMQYTSGTCDYVKQLKALGMDAPVVDKVATNATAATTGSVKPVPVKKALPPMPKSNSTNQSGQYVLDSGSSAVVRSTFIGSSLLAMALLMI